MAKTPTVAARGDDRRRSARVAQRVREELTLILARELGDPRVKELLISEVEVTEDLSLARVSFALIGEDPKGARAKDSLKVLKRITPTLRAKLAPGLNVRRVPELEFRLDTGREDAMRIDAVLYEVSQELAAREAPPEDEPG